MARIGMATLMALAMAPAMNRDGLCAQARAVTCR